MPLPNAKRLTRKRHRHVFQACERCKRQKVRCNGKKPCDKCEKKRPEECFYALRYPFITESHSNDVSCTSNSDVHVPAEASHNREPPSVWNTALALDLTKMVQSQSEKLDLLLEKTEENKGLLNERLLIRAEQQPLTKPSTTACVSHDIKRHSVTMPYKQLLPFFRGPSGTTFYTNAIGMIGCETENTSREAYTTLEGDIVIERDREDIQDNLDHQDFDDSSTHMTPKPQHGLLLSPLEEIDGEMAVHLVHLYGSFVGVTHPILPIDDLRRSVRRLYSILAKDSHSPVDVDDISIGQVGRSELNIVKMVFAIAVAMDGGDHNGIAARLFASIQHDVDNTIWAAKAELDDLHVLILVSIYHSVKGDSRLSWRIIGSLTRLILEFGLHRSKVLIRIFKEPRQYKKAINTFWMAIVLDCQLSYALGLPRHIRDKDVDDSIPLPDDAPYLTAMISYCRLGSRISDSVSDVFGGLSHYARVWRESFEFFQHQLNQWQEKYVPKILKPNGRDTDAKGARHFHTVLYLRANQLRLMLIRPALYSFELQEAANIDLRAMAASIACDSIQVLLDLFDETDIYQMQQTQYNNFLMTALGALLGVLAQERSSLPVDQVDSSAFIKAREFVTAALALIKSTAMSSKSSEHQSAKVFSLCSRLGLLPATPSDTPNLILDDLDVDLFQNGNDDADFSHFLLPEYQLGPMWADLDIGETIPGRRVLQ